MVISATRCAGQALMRCQVNVPEPDCICFPDGSKTVKVYVLEIVLPWTRLSARTLTVEPAVPGPPSPGTPVQNVFRNRLPPSGFQVPVPGGPAGLMSWAIKTPPAAKLATPTTLLGLPVSWRGICPIAA